LAVAKDRGFRYALTAMATVINLEENIGKTVGKRHAPADPLLSYNRSKEEALRWKAAFGTPRIPKGLYRFKTHEEADEWLWKMITRPTKK
jgi:hypothetical protein